MSHVCPAPDCDREVASSQFACPKHWYRLPAGMRSAIWTAYKQEPLGEAHREAMATARTWLRGNA
jgi:hypothetical protein